MIALHSKGVAHHVADGLIGRIVFEADGTSNAILVNSDRAKLSQLGKAIACLTTISADCLQDFNGPVIGNLPSISQYQSGDIVIIHPSGLVSTLYRINSPHNTLFTTDQCNSNCLMCSQPPKRVDDILHHYQINSRLLELLPKDLLDLGITGGEPTLMGNLFFELLKKCTEQLPDTAIHVLTNGRSFADPSYTSQFADLDHSQVVLGIPLYADYDQTHDYIVQAKGAFNETLLGLYQLGQLGVRIEIRVVIHKVSVPRLVKLAQFIYHNLPFVEHIALMGLEYVGYTPYNAALLWQEPREYMTELIEATEYLDRMGMNVSLYNFPLCVLPTKIWQFARKSISDWKQTYVPECNSCLLINECGGVFATSRKLTSQIKPYPVS